MPSVRMIKSRGSSLGLCRSSSYIYRDLQTFSTLGIKHMNPGVPQQYKVDYQNGTLTDYFTNDARSCNNSALSTSVKVSDGPYHALP